MTTKILHIPNYYPPHIGGIEEVCYSIVSGISGYEQKVICFHDRKKTEKSQYEGVEVIRCGVIAKLFSQSISFSFFCELRKILRTFHPDIVHFHTPNTLITLYLLLLLPRRARLIVHWHSDIVEQTLLYFFFRPIEKCLLKRADKILVTSPLYPKGSKPLTPFLNKLEVIPNTVNPNKLDKQIGDDEAILKIREMYGGKKIAFTFGRHVPYKGLKFLIEALPKIDEDTVVVIAGKGVLSDELKRKSNGCPNVFFIGRIDDNTLRQYLYAADVFVFPSITRNEAFGIALAEAMYCGLPAVTFTIPYSGVNWVSIAGETGLEVENGDAEGLAEAINQLMENPVLRKNLAENASQRARDCFTVDSIKKDLIKLYDESSIDNHL